MLLQLEAVSGDAALCCVRISVICVCVCVEEDVVPSQDPVNVQPALCWLEATDGRISAAGDTERKEDPFILYEDDSTHAHTQSRHVHYGYRTRTSWLFKGKLKAVLFSLKIPNVSLNDFTSQFSDFLWWSLGKEMHEFMYIQIYHGLCCNISCNRREKYKMLNLNSLVIASYC